MQQEILSALFKGLLNVWWVLPILIALAALKSSTVKGYFGELLVKLTGRLMLNRSIYIARHNVTLQLDDGTTQIDHLYVSRFGVFVVETKNMKGWIFGSANQSSWTQKVFKKSYKFQNPLRQNYRHTRSIVELLDVPEEAVYSVIAFVGNCKLKTELPDNVTIGGGYIRYIKSKGEILLTEEQVDKIVSAIDSKKLAANLATNRQHVRNLKDKNEGK